ncbi:hypothetical protein [Celeribacter sp. PS-C1]|uniref:hypothetical protein n=1 Tax=Celeribacter sp. PS-C1 TaxID=2820813 RepID=UPI001CA5C499|nr:hypothetical protein [Celeribacter sp. PS-C1]MBW6418301.1 hypothetical protein [Celeribacter sp. PS-C1]
MKNFDQMMFDIYRRAKEEAGYNATAFLTMLNERGGIDTAKSLLNSRMPSSGYAALYERGRLDLTVEAMIVENPECHALFSPEELQAAKRRLREFRYKPRT